MNKAITLALLSILVIASCQEINYNTVPTGSECGSYRPRSSEECTSVNNTKEFCCLMTSPSGNNFCYRVDVQKWKYRTSLRIREYFYQMKCDVLQDLFDAIFGTTPVESVSHSAPTSNEGRTETTDESGAPIDPDQCGKPDPAAAEDCTAAHTLTEFCCLLKPQAANNKAICKKFSTRFITVDTGTVTIGTDNYDVSCNIREGSQGLPCGPASPTALNECTVFSNDWNSCCLYKDNNKSFCLWLGYKGNEGNIMNNLTC